MAASLTLSAVTVAADGKTVTATIGGGTGPYSVSSAIGLSLKLPNLNKNVFVIASQSVSGSTLTMNLYSPVGTGEAVTFTIATAATITDSASNTPAGQANLAVTNNSAVAVSFVTPVAAGIETVGPFVWDGTLLRGNSAGWSSGVTDNYAVEFVADATDIAVVGYSGSTYSIAVDNAAASNPPTLPSADWSVQPVRSTALAVGKHLIRLSFNDYIYGFRLAGGSRTVVSTTTAKANMISGATGRSLPAATPVTCWGTYNTTTVAGSAFTGSYSGFYFDVGFTGSGLEVATVLGGNWAARIDGAQWGPLQEVGGPLGQNAMQTIVTGLGGGSHTAYVTQPSAGSSTTVKGVRVINGTTLTTAAASSDTTLVVGNAATIAVNDWVKIDRYTRREVRQVTAISGTTLTLNAALSSAHAVGMEVTSYSAPAGTLSYWVHKDLSGRRLVAMGDSNTQGANQYGLANPPVPDADGNYYAFYDPRTTCFYRVGENLGIEVVNLGIQGTDTINQAVRMTSAEFATLSKGSYDYVTLWEGTNDVNGNTTTPAQYETNLQTQITAAKAGLRAGGKIILMPPFTPQNVTSSKGLSTTECQARMLSVAAANTDVTVVVATNLYNGVTNADLNDSLHYKQSGQDKIYNNFRALFENVLPQGMTMAVA